MKITWFHGLALSLGISTVPSVVHAQYNNPQFGTPGSNGLAPSSFQLPPMPNQQQPTAPQGQFAAAPQIPPQQFVGQPYAAPQPAPSARVPGSMVAYNQHGGSVGSGIEAHSHLPSPAPVQSQYSQPPLQSAPQPVPQPAYEHGSTATYGAPAGNDSCGGCATGNCGVHGTGYSSGPVYGLGESYGYGYGGGSYGCNDGSCGPGFGGGLGHRPILGGGGIGGARHGIGGAWGSYGAEEYSVGGGCGSVGAPSPWIFGAGGLLMTRVDDSDVLLSHDGNMPSDGLLSTGDAAMKLSGGFQGSVGRYFGGGRYALIGTYWGLYPQEQTRYITAGPGQDLSSRLPWTIQDFGGAGPGPVGVPRGLDHPTRNGFNWYDMAEAHRITRSSEIHNVEVNFNWFALGGAARAGEGDCGKSLTGPNAPWYGAQCSKLRFNLFAGVRYFRFSDNLEYATNQGDYVFNRNDDDFYYSNNVVNDLVGFQIGSLGQLALGSRANLYAGTSFGIYNNKISADTRAGTDSQVATIASDNYSNGMAYDFMRTKNDVAFLGEGNIGVGYRVWRGWTANVGYRVVGVSGVATAVGQIPYDFSNSEEAAKIRNDRSLILHGGVFGMNYNF